MNFCFICLYYCTKTCIVVAQEGEDGGTGGAVDDEDLFGDDDEDEAPAEGQAAAQEPSPPKPKKLKGRLKRPRDSGEGEEGEGCDMG